MTLRWKRTFDGGAGLVSRQPPELVEEGAETDAEEVGGLPPVALGASAGRVG